MKYKELKFFHSFILSLFIQFFLPLLLLLNFNLFDLKFEKNIDQSLQEPPDLMSVILLPEQVDDRNEEDEEKEEQDEITKKNIEITPPKKIDGEVASKIELPKVEKKVEKKEKKLPPLPSVFQDIKPVKKVKPKYPIEAENKKIEGTVLAKLKVELDGTVSNVIILEANPINVFEEEVTQAAYKYLFRKDGTTYYAVQEFIFKIDP